MNIFVTSPDPVQCALVLDDKRVNKMVLETAQLLSSALRVRGVERSWMYKDTHANHPCAVFTRATQSNFEWVVNHGLALATVYQSVYRREHRSAEIIARAWAWRDRMPDGDLTKFVNCTPFDVKTYPDFTVFERYQKTLIYKWWALDDSPPRFAHRKVPEFYSTFLKTQGD